MREPNPAAIDWRSQAALAYAALDQPDAALALAREELELARRFGAAARDRDRAAHARRDRRRPRRVSSEAVDVLAASPARLEHARALADLGVALRHRRRIVEAREPLRRALDLAIRCGATPLAERARTELLIAGARPRRPQLSGVDALTTNERRVAALAADGTLEPGDRPGALREPQDRREAPHRRLPQARRRRARGPAGRARKRVGVPPHTRAARAAGMLGAMSKDRPHRPPVHGSGHLPALDGPPDAQRRHPRVYSRTPRSS